MEEKSNAPLLQTPSSKFGQEFRKASEENAALKRDASLRLLSLIEEIRNNQEVMATILKAHLNISESEWKQAEEQVRTRHLHQAE